MSNATTPEYLDDVAQAACQRAPAGYSLSYEYPGFVCVRHDDLLPGIYACATPGWEADEADLARGDVEVPVQWDRDADDGRAHCLGEEFRLQVTGDLDADVAAYLAVVERVVAAVRAATQVA